MIGLSLWTWFLSAMFGVKSLMVGARATHPRGAGASGRLEILPSEAVPAHVFFARGAVLPVRLRHATLAQPDDAAKDIRSASMSCGDGAFDLFLHTGTANVFWDIPSFMAFVRASIGGEASLKALCERSPKANAAAAGGMRRAPSSFALLSYESMMVMRWADAAAERLVRYRLVPGDGETQDGVPDDADRAAPWAQARLANETRGPDYLAAEWATRLAAGPVVYRLEVQLRLRESAKDADYDAGAAWDPALYPWHRLGLVTLDAVLDAASLAALRLRVDHQPSSLGLFDARSSTDFNALGHVRARLYPWAQAARRLRGG